MLWEGLINQISNITLNINNYFSKKSKCVCVYFLSFEIYIHFKHLVQQHCLQLIVRKSFLMEGVLFSMRKKFLILKSSLESHN